MGHVDQPAVEIVLIPRLLPLGVGTAGDVVRAVVNIADGAVLRVGGASEVVAAPGKGAGLSAALGLVISLSECGPVY